MRSRDDTTWRWTNQPTHWETCPNDATTSFLVRGDVGAGLRTWKLFNVPYSTICPGR